MEIDGTKISNIRTRKSMYDQDNLEVEVDGQIYMLNCKDILIKMVNEFKFAVMQKRKHKYLIP